MSVNADVRDLTTKKFDSTALDDGRRQGRGATLGNRSQSDNQTPFAAIALYSSQIFLPTEARVIAQIRDFRTKILTPAVPGG